MDPNNLGLLQKVTYCVNQLASAVGRIINLENKRTYTTTGTATLISGVVTITSPILNSNDIIHAYLKTTGGTPSNFYIISNIIAGVSFKVTGTTSDGSTINTSDHSVISYVIYHI